MVDKITFVETLRSIQELVKTSSGPLSKEEIRGYFQDMELSEEQQEMIYQFLQTPQDETTKEAGKKTEKRKAGDKETSERAQNGRPGQKKTGKRPNPHFQMYLNEISAVPVLEKSDRHMLYRCLLSGEEAAIGEISSQWLKRVTQIAEEYVTPQAFLEDLVQEGNISLLLGLGQFLGKGAEYGTAESSEEILEEAWQARLDQKLESCIRQGMERYRRELEGETNGENAILAKVSLLHEARKALAEENGTDPTIEELCDYTKIPPEEIADILALHEKARKKGGRA